MAAGIFLRHANDLRARQNGITGYVGIASSSNEFRALVDSMFSGDSLTGAIAEVTTGLAAADYAGWKFEIRIYLPSGAGKPVAKATYVGVADDDIDDVGTALAALLAAQTLTASAAYDTGTNVLLVDTATLGAHQMVVECTAPGAERPMASPPMVGTITDGGGATDDLKVVLVAANPIPTLYKTMGKFGVL